MKIGVVDVGGGLRDIYGAGVFDTLIRLNERFDYAVGVSAGSANISSFASGQVGRNYRFYIEYSKRPEYMSFSNLIKKGSYLDVNYIYGTLYNSDGEDPLDYDKLMENPMDFSIAATVAETGETHFFQKSDMVRNDYGPLKASSNLPIVNKAFVWRGVAYFDGGVSNSIPYQYAFDQGCDHVVIILTQPIEHRKKQGSILRASVLLKKKNPQIYRLLKDRCELYNRQLEEAIRLQEEGKVYIIAPENIGKMKTLTKDPESLQMMYEEGLKDGNKVAEYLKKIRTV